jgi:adenylate cyclase
MAGKRAKFFETRYFGFVLGAISIAIIAAMSYESGLLQPLELMVLDTHFGLKSSSRGKTVQEGSVLKEKNPKISDDIQIVGVDSESLSKLGLWPFPRGKHGDLINAFSRIKDQTKRENAILLDVLFSSETDKPLEDKALAAAMRESGRVFLETSLLRSPDETSAAAEMAAREELLAKKFGTLKKVSGEWQEMPAFLAAEAPLPVFAEEAASYGHATYVADRDKIFRKQPLVGKLSTLVAVLPLETLTPGFTVDQTKFERLAWMDSDGVYHNIDTPLSASSLAKLRSQMEASAPKKLDTSAGSDPTAGYFIVRKFQDSFIPAVTLSLALRYFGKTLDDADVIVGDRIRIPSPTRYDPDTGERRPYEIELTPPTFDAAGNQVKAGTSRVLPNIDIPIDENGMMLINFMGPPSSESADGVQTFPVRSYSAYSERAPAADPASWRRASMAAANKIIMVGAFSTGMSADDKQTPMGIMYGIEVHANALNTILMDNFIHEAPVALNLGLLFALVMLVSFLTSRPGMSLFIALGITVVLIAGYFLAVTMIFDSQALLLNFTSPAIAMFLTFVAIIVYRAMTEERDKRRTLETFGKYVSPDVASVLVEGEIPSLGGTDKMITVFFSDIRGFTSLSETMSPQELVNHLNIYLTEMTNIIMEYRGTLDKYVGDEVMCYWGAPLDQEDHAILACKCALRQMSRLRELNQEWPENRRINIGIGLNSGIMTWGNMGSPLRMNITLMGDNVNLGARLEGTNKEYGTNIIISENTYSLVKDKFIARELDNIRVKGKSKPVLMYELVDCLEDIGPGPVPKKVR